MTVGYNTDTISRDVNINMTNVDIQEDEICNNFFFYTLKMVPESSLSNLKILRLHREKRLAITIVTTENPVYLYTGKKKKGEENFGKYF